MNVNLDQQDIVIVADGTFLPHEIIQEMSQNKVIIALDAAADKLARLGIYPHLLLGDLDASDAAHASFWGIQQTFADIHDGSEPYLGHHNVTIVPQKNQQLTDLVKAIRYCDEHHAKSITLICATGGRLDHHEAALRSLRSEYKSERPLVLHTEQQSVCLAKDESLTIQGEIGDKCAILAYPQATLTSQGLMYDVADYKLIFGFSESIANSLSAPTATISIEGEALVIMPPQFASQREFMRKTEVKQLGVLLREAGKR